VICVGAKDKYITPTMARVGDSIIITKGAAVEASGLFAVTFPQKVAEHYGEKIAREAEEIFWQMSVVEDALTVVEVGVREDGVTAMHDATECGVWGGLFEIAQASRVGVVVDKEKIIVQDVIGKVCDLFNIDPYSSISEGTLILTCRPHKEKEVLQRLLDKRILASTVGEIVPKEEGMHYFEYGKMNELVHPRVDPFWIAFGKAASEGR
jgi:hydrogenase maturation factor